jgi:hypothetical protein
MEPLKPLSNFFIAIASDGRISITHIGVYAALLQYQTENDFANPIKVFSHQITEIAKISRITYSRCVRELSEYGYIKYIPSFKCNQASKIYFPESN